MKTKPLYQDILNRMGEDDISIIKRIVSNYTFIDYGIVQEYNEGRLTVKLAHQLLGQDVQLTNIEVLTGGSKAFSIKHTLVKGDVVQLMSSKSLVDSVAELTKATLNAEMPYSTVTVKAIPLANFANAKNKLDISDDGSYKITGKDYSVEVTTNGTIKITGKNLELNGNSKSFVTGDELATALQNHTTALNLHVHTSAVAGSPTSPPAAPMSIDISSAKTTTVKTGG